MNEEEVFNEESRWFSTYGLITSERILGSCKINLSQEELMKAIKTPSSFYHRIVKTPLKNVLNGIILQQANDYSVYVNKLFIDYLLSGANSKNPDSQGALTRESIENERQQLLVLAENFSKLQEKHNFLIAKSQASLLKISATFTVEFNKTISSLKKTLNYELDSVRRILNNTLIYCDMKDLSFESITSFFIDTINEGLNITMDKPLNAKVLNNVTELAKIVISAEKDMEGFFKQANEINQEANSFRAEFYQTIVRVIELMKLLPDYKINPEQDLKNREFLFFDNSIGSLG